MAAFCILLYVVHKTGVSNECCFFSIPQSYTCNLKLMLLQGEKVFYFVEPTEENFSQYEKWVSSARQSEVFFGDMVKNCYKCAVKPGQTMFIPTGTDLFVTCTGEGKKKQHPPTDREKETEIWQFSV